MWDKKEQKEPAPAAAAIAPEQLKALTGLTPEEERIAPSPEVAKEIHDSIYPQEEKKQVPAKLSEEEKEKLAELASKTNVLRSILVNVKGIASDVRAILIALVSLSWAIVGLVFSVSILIFFLMLVLAAMSSRFAYVFFSLDKDKTSTQFGTLGKLKEAVHRTIVGR